MIDSAGENLLKQATVLHESGDFAAAEKIYRHILQKQPLDQVRYLLGTLLLQKGEYRQALEYLEPIAENYLDDADLHNNLGLAYGQLQENQKAQQAFEQALVADPEFGPAYWNLGKLFTDCSDWLLAEANYQLAMQYLSDVVEVRWEYSYCLMQTEQWEKAITVLAEIQQQNIPPRLQREMLSRLAYLFAQLKRNEEAITLYEVLLQQEPNSAQILSNLSYLYERTGQIDLAIDRAEQAIRNNPQRPEMLNNRGIAFRSAHRLTEAEQDFRQAIAINPDFSLAKFNLGSLQLLQEQYPAGWSGYEARARFLAPGVFHANLPLWQGASIKGQTLLVENDQGFGDALQFLRFLPQFQQRSEAQLVLRLPASLVPLVRASMEAGLLPEFPVVDSSRELPPADQRVALASAGYLFQLTEHDFKANNPYLCAAQTGVIEKTHDTPYKIGLCWRGNPDQAQDHVRTLPFSQLLSLRNLPDVEFHALQLDISAQEKRNWPELIDHASEMTSFAETARILQSLDLLITVDTAICHLAGGMHFPVWTLLTHTPDWRWHLQRSDSPWYPSMRLFRQPEWGNWKAVLQQVLHEIHLLNQAHKENYR